MTGAENHLEDRVARLEAECHRIQHRLETLERLMGQLLQHLPPQTAENA